MLRLCHLLALLFCITSVFASDEDTLAIISSGFTAAAVEEKSEPAGKKSEAAEIKIEDSTANDSEDQTPDTAQSELLRENSYPDSSEIQTAVAEPIESTESMLNSAASEEPEVSAVESERAAEIALDEQDTSESNNAEVQAAVLSSESVNDSTDTLRIIEREDRQYIYNILKSKSHRKDSLDLVRNVQIDESATTYYYHILRNGKAEWELTLQTPANDLEELFVKRDHNRKLESNTIVADSLEKGSYRVSPWVTIPSIFNEERDSLRVQKFFGWKSGGTVAFNRNHHYNFYGPAGDTAEPFIDLAKPALYDYKLKMDYTHQYKKIWFGGGIERSYQKSHYFDTLSVDRRGWFSRMGWNLHFAVPGFRYEIYRDPGLIPFYGLYEDSIYTKLNRDADYEYLKRLNLSEYDSTMQLEEDPNIPGKMDTNWVTTEIAPLGGVAHKFMVKAGYFKYSVMIHPRAYKRPIQKIEMDDLPFFKGEWNVAMTFLPNRQIIPHAEFDFFRTTIPLRNTTLGVSPLHFEIEVWDRLSFYMSIGFNAEFLTKKPAETDKE